MRLKTMMRVKKKMEVMMTMRTMRGMMTFNSTGRSRGVESAENERPSLLACVY